MKQSFLRWLKKPFHGNPLVEQPDNYAQQLKGVYQFWLRLVLVLLGGTVLLYIILIVAVINGWL
ncbi:MAG: hypothetical protein HYV33_06460 [Candidatus Kerfeldbacteria bacterium]|nr:hypothetical protein [Candidatus Kerfeldbacteria bacterium]